MNAEYAKEKLRIQGLGRREVVGWFDDGEINSDAVVVLVHQLGHRTRTMRHLSECFTDDQDLDRIEYSFDASIKHRVLSPYLGYEDLSWND